MPTSTSTSTSTSVSGSDKVIDKKSPFLLIDLGYAMFYRYSATQVWYKHSHPEEKDKLTKDYKWYQNEEFIEKMKKMFVSDILTLAKKYKISKSNIIIAEDCRLKDNWRVPFFSEYKSQRSEEREKNGWQGGPAFEIIVNEVIPEMIKTNGIHHLKHPKIEADDIISQIILKDNKETKKDEKEKDKEKKMKFIIVASDNDYFQILEDNVDLINMKGVSQKEKMKYSPKGHLIEKILKGDVSDNIKACNFSKKWGQDLVPGMPKKASVDSGLYLKATKKFIDYYLENPDKLEVDVQNVSCQGDEYIKGYKENKKIIDFTELPDEYVEDVDKMYNKLFGIASSK